MQKEKVIIELSGGVDSSVAAYLLKENDYYVIGVTFSIWKLDADYSCDKNCCNEESVITAKRVAARLDIPHYNICLKDIFYEKVVKDFVKNYESGLTPNPCVACNKFIKFSAVAENLKHLAPFKIATGHYAGIIYDAKSRTYKLFKGVDPKKDQSYFLYCLKQNELKNILFPLGDMTKEKVRRLAKKIDLPTQSKKESMEVCFVPGTDYKKFFKLMKIKSKPGNILDTAGKKLGTHNGIFNYTIGQRRGLGISSKNPLYVISIDAKDNSIIVGEDKDLFTNKVYVEDINWIAAAGTVLDAKWRQDCPQTMRASVRIRYNMKEKPAQINLLGKNKAEIMFDEPVRAATPGQSAVFYDGDEVLGGGVIVSSRQKSVGSRR